MGKKIIQHYLFSGLGGHGGVFFSLVEADKEKEFEYRALFCGVEQIREEYKTNCEQLGVPYYYLQKKKGLDFSAYFKTFGQFRKNKPAVIFIHGAGYSIIPAFWYKLTKPSTRIIVRDTQAHHLKSKTEWFWMFFVLLLSKRLVFLTAASADDIKKKFGWWARRKKFVIIPNGLKIENYKQLVRFKKSDPIEIGMQSRMQPIKDHPVLLKAFRLLKDRNPGLPIRLQIAGEGDTLPAIQALAAELGLKEDIQFHGMLGGASLLNMMESLDIYVHATMGETLSNSIMQAMACGLPIIASDVWGVNNMIENESNGWLYAPGNVEELADKMHRLIHDVERRKQLGATARKFAEDNYDNKVMFQRYRQLF